ncbi:MAG: hypothetical protein ABR985_17710 [Methanotrichaceae archaeon]|jgi:hypothetical protein
MQTIEYQPGDKAALQKAIERTNCLLLTDVTELTNMTELRQRIASDQSLKVLRRLAEQMEE